MRWCALRPRCRSRKATPWCPARLWLPQKSALWPGAQALIRRKVKMVDKDALVHIKVPLPLPLAWGRSVAPYAPPGERWPGAALAQVHWGPDIPARPVRGPAPATCMAVINMHHCT